MSTLEPRRAVLAAARAAAALALIPAAGCAIPAQFPDLDDAEMHVSLALDALRRAPDRFGGHKAEAERLLRQSLDQIAQAKWFAS